MKTCKWKLLNIKSRYVFYEIECGIVIALNETIKSNKYKYCPYCSGEIKQ